MAFMDLFNTEEEPIVPTQEPDLSSLDKKSFKTITDKLSVIAKKIKGVKKDWSDSVSSQCLELKDMVSSLHASFSLKEEEGRLEPILFVRLEDLLAQCLVSFERKKRYQDQYFCSQFLQDIKSLTELMESDFCPEFRNDEYFETYAIWLFAHCEEAQASNDLKDLNQVVDYLEEQFEKNPKEELENKLNEMKRIQKETKMKSGDYTSIEKAIHWELEDIRKTMRREERQKKENW